MTSFNNAVYSSVSPPTKPRYMFQTTTTVCPPAPRKHNRRFSSPAFDIEPCKRKLGFDLQITVEKPPTSTK